MTPLGMTTRWLRPVRHVARWLLSCYPKIAGYRWVRSVRPTSIRSSSAQSMLTFGAKRATFAPPSNLGAGDLSRTSGVSGYSWRDAIDREIDAVSVCVVNDVEVVESLDEWNNGFYGLLWRDSIALDVTGSGWRREHAAIVSDRRIERLSLPCGAWFIEVWSGNYFHWMTRCLPKAHLLSQAYPDLPLLVPSGIRLSAFQQESLAKLGLSDRVLHLPSRRTQVHSLAVVEGMTAINPEMLLSVRQRLCVTNEPSLDIFVSRRNAKWRRLRNENELADRLAARSFVSVTFEDLSFQQQIELMSKARTLVGVHGAGLTNMMFARPGLRVVEIADPEFTNPDYFWLARSSGHGYALVNAEVQGERRPGYHDLRVDVVTVLRAVDHLSL